MRKHIVTCVKCGRQFDTNEEKGQYYPDSRRYECGRCVAAQKKAQKEQSDAKKAEERKAKADEREARTGMRQSVPAMIAKIAAGVVVLVSSLSLLSQGIVFEFIVGVVIAVGLAAWWLVPYLKAKKTKEG